MNNSRQEGWITIDDPQVTAAALEARVEARLARHRAELGRVTRRFPSFQGGSLDEGGEGNVAHGALQDVLRQLETAPPPATDAALAPSPATRLPLLGRLWRLARRQAHELVLFYVNRHLAHQTRVNHLAARALRELGAQLAQQEARIEALEARLAEQQRSDEQADG